MGRLCRQRFLREIRGRLCLAIVFMLCLCVVLQMLGVPATLLNPADAADNLASSVLEGFSVPPALPQLSLSSESFLLVESHPSAHVSLLASQQFHPPVR